MTNFKPGLILRTPHHPLLGLATKGYVVPAHIDRRPELLPCSDQGNTSQCVAFAVAGWLEYCNWKFKGIARQIDPIPIYKRAKEIDGYQNEEGTTLEFGLQAAQDLGLISYVDTTSIRTVDDPAAVKQALHRYGVIISAFNVTGKWSNASPGGWIAPGGESIGGHAVVLCGYSTVENPPWYAIQNSWGGRQGWRGFNRISPETFAGQFKYGLVWDFKRA